MRNDEHLKQLTDTFGDWFKDERILGKGVMTNKLYPYQKLFEPIKINHLCIKNRIVMGPMGNVAMSDETGKPGVKMKKYFEERAKGGVGLITSGMVPVDYKRDPSVGDLDDTGIFPRIDSHRSNLAGWKDVVEGCHAYGSHFFIQLSPGMGRVGNPECILKKKKLPVSSSWNPNWYMPDAPCRPLSDLAIKKIIKNTGQAAADAKEIGIDGVYLHGHSGYLIEQMTDTAFNRRKLGRYANRQNFGIDLVREIRLRCGEKYPIHYRIDLSLCLHETYGKEIKKNSVLKKFKNGRLPEETLSYMETLVKEGVDVFDVDIGGYENWWMPHPPNGMPPGAYLSVAKRVKEHFEANQVISNTGLPVPVIAVGKLGFPDLAEQALRDGLCDMVMLARSLLADPEWPNKVYSGRVSSIRPCIGDHEGCLGQLATGGHPHCAVNPRAGFEDCFHNQLNPIINKKKIGVIGGGPAGVITAITAAKRGHDVTLYDENNRVGGMLLAGSVPHIKFELKNYVDYLNKSVEEIVASHALKLQLNTKVDATLLVDESFEVLVFSTGSKMMIPPIEGRGKKHVITGIQFLKDPTMINDAENVIVVGGSDVGCEVAYMLAYEMSRKVTILEMDDYFMRKSCTSNRGYMLYHLHKKGVKLLNATKLLKIDNQEVVVQKNVHKSVPEPHVTWSPVLPDNIKNPLEKKVREELETERIHADAVIMCTGVQSNQRLYEEVYKKQLAKEIYNIGDAFICGRVLEAVKAGYAIGNAI
ncbi:oxidoreductase [Vallitalea okinawensis]|uniref:oxidoreductase n=1 Tax=Vallitalea okinawensis TaxID=2078660 RepID=UPI000CFB7AF2|nr:FAD-dependent oxidoreductase [Vallitalea okinawensis]